MTESRFFSGIVTASAHAFPCFRILSEHASDTSNEQSEDPDIANVPAIQGRNCSSAYRVSSDFSKVSDLSAAIAVSFGAVPVIKDSSVSAVNTKWVYREPLVGR